MKLKKNRFFLSSSGFSFIEIMLGLALITISGSATSYLLLKSKQNVNQVIMKTTRNIEISNVIEMIRQNIDVMQIHYDSSNTMTLSKMTKDNMPWAFNQEIIYAASECPDCQGKFGYIIQPSLEIRSLYNVKLRVYHTSLGENFIEYNFIVSSK